MGRVKVTGYLNIEDDQADPESPTGLTEEAYLDLAADEMGGSPKLCELEDIDFAVE